MAGTERDPRDRIPEPALRVPAADPVAWEPRGPMSSVVLVGEPEGVDRAPVSHPEVGRALAAEIVLRSIRGHVPVVVEIGQVLAAGIDRGSVKVDVRGAIPASVLASGAAIAPVEIVRVLGAAIALEIVPEIAPALVVEIVRATDRVESATLAVPAIVLVIGRATVRARDQGIVRATATCRGWDRTVQAGTMVDVRQGGPAAVVAPGTGGPIKVGALVAGGAVRAGEHILAGVRTRGPIQGVGAGITVTARPGVATAGTPGGTVIPQQWPLA